MEVPVCTVENDCISAEVATERYPRELLTKLILISTQFSSIVDHFRDLRQPVNAF